MSLKELFEQIKRCKKCHLYKTRTKAVPGEGNSKAEIVFIGEAPGAEEDLLGRPFVGSAGKFLDEMLASIKLKRKDVFITNIVHCRPPANRDPLPYEIETCWPYTQAQLKAIKPKLIVCLGRHALWQFWPKASISKVHGQVLKREIPNLGKIIFLALFHPAAALHQANLKETLKKDFKKIPKVLEKVDKL